MQLLLKTSKSINIAKPLSTCSLQWLESVWKYEPTLGIQFSTVVGAGRKAGMQRWLCCFILVFLTVWHGLHWIAKFSYALQYLRSRNNPARSFQGLVLEITSAEHCYTAVYAAPVLAGDSPSHRRLKPLPKPIQNNPQSVPPKQQRALRGGEEAGFPKCSLWRLSQQFPHCIRKYEFVD